MASLQEQLLKAGLTTKQKARQANSDKRKKGKQKRSGVNVESSLQEQVKQDLELAKKEKLARDIALNNEKKQALLAKEQQLRILQILQHHQVTNVNGEAEYNYTFNNKIKKLFVDAITHKALVNGRLALCGVEDTTYIVTTETAEKVASLDEKVILVQNTKVVDEVVSDDDPYAEFQIPDDLMW
ncbi:DUF2058 domain-containing protein [Cognaticolwellia aestuarii]|uniref:DUF2058 domain-containing protein n=1 Tax=Cognaticolwellia aestuarii TaxID=329993 RepID=UPI0009842BA9|nr:DUF2058 domain-containing protein [Cognaticolwellia aestuarii]|tara:strand:- start:5316 stop:5867 length:552 start_codon:yes stop_codon:yes gene_type:complete